MTSPTTLTVYIVREFHTDYDDYPIGQKRILFATADLERAKRETHWQLALPPRTARDYTTVVIEDIDLSSFLS